MYIDKLDSLTKEIRTIQNKYNLNDQSLEIMIVTKKQSSKIVSELIDNKHNYFGENRVDELVDKKKLFPSARFAFIAPIQSRKLATIMDYSDEIHSISREKEIQIMSDSSWGGEYFIQVNIDNEPQKSGVEIEKAVELVDYAKKEYRIPSGLMCIRSLSKESNPSVAFEKMKELNETIKIIYPEYMSRLSMGMSNDYREAIIYGSTVVRIGSKIFGL
tara:strand:+ start:232 stop:882 length:651 start_codon:yes stop_codon:yes gene_type:complete